MKSVKRILDEALQEIQPDEQYKKQIFEKLNDIIRKINRNSIGAKAVLGGSGAKGTWLKTFDADIFVLFDYKRYRDKSGQLPDILEKILRKKSGKITRLHGSRDYFQIKEQGFTFEIVPILRIKRAEQARNITDVSPLHSKWVSRHKKLINDMKLTKQFCKAQNVYGAESYIKGFSGYVCEILTTYYGSFTSLMRNAAKWSDKVVIDAGKYYRGKDVFKTVNTSKLVSPLVVIDPVQKDRNAAAALSVEKFEAFRKSAKKFLERPSKEFFVKKDMDKSFMLQKTGPRKLLIIKSKPLAGKMDVVGSKLLKIYEFLARQLERHGFRIIKSSWEFSKNEDAKFYFLLNKMPLQSKIEVEGPPLRMQQHVLNFKKIHKKTFGKKGKIFASEKRIFTKPEELLKRLIKGSFVRQRCKSISIKVV